MGDSPLGPVGGISPIGGIDPLLGIDAIPQIGTILANPPFRLADLPQPVQQSFAKGAGPFWVDTVNLAIGAGVREARKLADIIFFMQHPERMKAGVGRLIDPKDDDFYKTRAEWILYLTIVTRILDPKYKPTVFLPERASRTYEDFVAAPTTGRVTLMVNGRDSDGTGALDKDGKWLTGFKDDVSTFDAMQLAVEALGKGDSLYIANWQFFPESLPLTTPRTGVADWGKLLVNKATEGVKIRVLISQHPVGSNMMTDLAQLDAVIKGLPTDERDNFKYIVTAHPNMLGVHHRKFVVARRGKTTVAFCGGLDISFNRTPGVLPARPTWWATFVWHDVAAKLEGKITHDLEREFVDHWNHERTSSKADPLPGWKGFERLATSDGDGEAAVNGQKIQMLRTVSVGTKAADIRRDDVWRGYFRLIGRATRFLYLENQYFQEPKLADAIVKQAEAIPGLIVMVVVGTGTDDIQKVDPKVDWFTRQQQQALVDANQNMMALRLEFFTRLLKGIPANRVRVYTLNYDAGITHTKLVVADDEALTVGSANANPRGFFFDTEVNVILDDPKAVKDLRQRLWAHNLHVPVADVAKWTIGDFFARWDAVAAANARVQATPTKLVGEGVIPFKPTDPRDPRFRKGARIPILGLTGVPPEVLF